MPADVLDVHFRFFENTKCKQKCNTSINLSNSTGTLTLINPYCLLPVIIFFCNFAIVYYKFQMLDRSAANKRIAINTAFLYVRMLFLMFVNLYASRVVLKGLGVDDYGIYMVVGGFVALFSLVSAALTGACSRFLNFEMGKGNLDRLRNVFSTAVIIQCVLALIVLLLAETVGLWYVNNVMVYDAARRSAVGWCFQFSVFTFCMNLVSVPFSAAVVAHERMKVFAYVSIYQGIAILMVALLLSSVGMDKLIFYAGMLCIIQSSVQLAYQMYCRRYFEECRVNWSFDKPLLRRMLSYSLWHLIGNGAVVLKTYGVDVVLNIFFGTGMNAAKGISNQVDTHVNQFVGNFMMAMNPQITQSYAGGNLDYMFSLVNRGARFSFYLMLMLSLPIIINAHEVLDLWLVEVPDYAVIFVQLTLVVGIVSSLSRPLMTAQNATGNVRNYQVVVGGIVLLNLPLCFIALKLGADASVVVVIALVIELLALFVRVFMIPLTIKEFNAFAFVRNVILKCVFVSVVSCIVPCIMAVCLEESAMMFLLNVMVCFLCTSLTVFYVGCERSERTFLLNKASQIVHKVWHR